MIGACFRLVGLCGIVSGGARPGGIAQATIRQLAAAGAKITAVDVDKRVCDFASEVSASLEVKTNGGCAEAFVGDLGDFTLAERVVAKHMADYDRLDFVVNAAGGSLISSPVNARETRATHVEPLMRKNFYTATNLSNAAIPFLSQNNNCRRKTVINFGTVNGTPGWAWAREPALAAAKGALRAYTLAQGAEFRGVIDFLMISPASVMNPHSPVWAERLQDPRCLAILREIYLEFITAEQVAFLASFLLDPRSPCFAGHDLVVDTGVSALGLRRVREDGKWWLDVVDTHGHEETLEIPSDVLPSQIQTADHKANEETRVFEVIERG